jgi:hypothetical protein
MCCAVSACAPHRPPVSTEEVHLTDGCPTLCQLQGSSDAVAAPEGVEHLACVDRLSRCTRDNE